MKIKGDTITFGFITTLFIATMVGIGYCWYLTFREPIAYFADNCRHSNFWKPFHNCGDQTLFILGVMLLTVVTIVFTFAAIASLCITIKTLQKDPYALELVEEHNNGRNEEF